MGLLTASLAVSGSPGETEFFEKKIRLAGGGIKVGSTFGVTDEYGYRAVEDVLTIHDLHATILHSMGIDHERLTFRSGGRDLRLTDVHGQVIQQILS